jgi:phenylpyruvate tautomerase PptA (4-oxalocrotonate tautomerase family)
MASHHQSALAHGVEGFIQAIIAATPNGERIVVEYHPDGDWFVAKEPCVQRDRQEIIDEIWCAIDGRNDMDVGLTQLAEAAYERLDELGYLDVKRPA